MIHADDFRIQVNGLELAFRAALALGVPEREIYACLLSTDLAPQQLRTEVHEATVVGLQRLVKGIVRRSAPTDALLFVAVNHGGQEGQDGFLVTADPLDEFGDAPPAARLTPDVLAECLRPLAGPQILVIATCFAGAFLPLAEDPRRAVVAACSANERCLVSRAGGTCSAFLDELFGAWCGVMHPDVVLDSRLPLDQAFAQARMRLASMDMQRVPYHAGVNVWTG